MSAPPTVAEQVAATQRLLAGYYRTELNVLGGTIDEDDTTLTLAEGIEGIGRGTILGIADELVYVWGVDRTTGNVRVKRAMFGTTAAEHLLDDLVEVAPRFPRPAVRDALVLEIRSWAPKLYTIETEEIAFGSTDRAATILADGFLHGLDLLALAAIPASAQSNPQRLSGWLVQHDPAAMGYLKGLSWRVPEEVPAQLGLKLELLQALADTTRVGREPAHNRLLSALIAAMPVSGRVPIAVVDARWLEAHPERDPVLLPGHKVDLPKRPQTVSELTSTGVLCRVAHVAGRGRQLHPGLRRARRQRVGLGLGGATRWPHGALRHCHLESPAPGFAGARRMDLGATAQRRLAGMVF